MYLYYKLKMKHLLIVAALFGTLFISEGVSAQNQSRPQIEKESYIINIQVNGNRVVIENAAPKATIQIYSILGVKLKEYKMPVNGDDLQFDLPKGCFILKTDNVVRKIAIK